MLLLNLYASTVAAYQDSFLFEHFADSREYLSVKRTLINIPMFLMN